MHFQNALLRFICFCQLKESAQNKTFDKYAISFSDNCVLAVVKDCVVHKAYQNSVLRLMRLLEHLKVIYCLVFP